MEGKMKKNSVFYIFFALILSFGFLTTFSNKHSYAKTIENAQNQQLQTTSKEAYLMDARTGTVIYGCNEQEKRPIASMCKIMTLLLCFDAIDNGELLIDEQIPISSTASSMGGSQVFLEANALYPVDELLKSIVIASANDSCVALAERLFGSEENFVQKMNNKARELDMTNTVFTNCTGLPKIGQYSCAKDVAKMFSELLKHEQYFNYSNIWMSEIHHPKDRITQISNTNKLIKFYNGCDSGKTGFTSEAGHCLAASAVRDDTRLISVIIGAPDSKCRFKEVSSMFNYGFANYTTKKIIDSSSPLDITVNVVGGKTKNLQVCPKNSLYIFAHKNDKKAVEIDFLPLEKIKAPVNKGEIVGKLVIYDNSKEILSTEVIANENIEKETYFDVLRNVTEKWSIAS